MTVSPKMITRPAIWPVKVMRFHRQCRMTTMMTTLQMKCPAQSLKIIVNNEILWTSAMRKLWNANGEGVD